MTTITWVLIASAGFALLGVLLAIIKFRRAGLDMSFLEFARRLIKGGGFKNISANELDAMLEQDIPKLSVIDLRNKDAASKTPLLGSIARPFDSFLREVVVDEAYSPSDPIVLVCDTGKMSRVAANILVEDEGFTDVYNLSGGIKNWKRRHRRSCLPAGLHTIQRFSKCCFNRVGHTSTRPL